MKRPGRDARVNRSLFSLRSFFAFFLLVSFLVSCCFLLFLGGMELPREQLKKNALVTFGNVVFLSFLCAVIDRIRRKLTVEKPVNRILNAAHALAQGDFSARIQPLHRLGGRNEFDAIIEDFNKMAQELSGVETLRTDFISSVSHELKTPLAVIQNCGTMLSDPTLPEEKRLECARSVTGAARRLSELITNMLRLNKLENQQIFAQAAPFDLGEQLRECLLGFEDIWEEKQLKLEADIADLTIAGDAELLPLVWNNLFSNAIKFTPPGGRVTVRLRGQGEYAVVTVADTGCGITPEEGRHIFEKFYQGDPSRAAQGNGLGLALVKRVVDIVGGEITVESVAGQGSTFTVTLQRGLP